MKIKEISLFEFQYPMGSVYTGTMQRIKRMIDEFLPVLGVKVPYPKLKLYDSQSDALGETKWRDRVKNGRYEAMDNTIICISTAIIHDENLLRSVVAHELCHHAQILLYWAPEYKKHYEVTGTEARNLFNAHGIEWQRFANKMNAKYGKDFVTPTSDVESNINFSGLRPFYVLLVSIDNGNTIAAIKSNSINEQDTKTFVSNLKIIQRHLYGQLNMMRYGKVVCTQSIPLFKYIPSDNFSKFDPRQLENRPALEAALKVHWYDGKDIMPKLLGNGEATQ